jgi:hypothetical protein
MEGQNSDYFDAPVSRPVFAEDDITAAILRGFLPENGTLSISNTIQRERGLLQFYDAVFASAKARAFKLFLGFGSYLTQLPGPRACLLPQKRLPPVPLCISQYAGSGCKGKFETDGQNNGAQLLGSRPIHVRQL